MYRGQSKRQMSQRDRIVFVLFSLAVCLALSSASAQTGIATLEGIVEDSSGARIPQARLKLVNVLTGAENEAVTGHDGTFLLGGVLAGSYSLEIERDGFATAQVVGLSLNPGEVKSLLIRLRVGPVSETVEIDAPEITIDTTDPSVQTAVDQQFVAHVPINGRSFQDLITMTPGVLTQSPQAAGSPLGSNGSLSVNGQKTDANYFLVDGVSGNFGAADLTGARKSPSDGSQPALTAIGTTQTLASVDALEEFRVLSSSYSAEYGTVPGGQFILTTRSGAGTGRNGLHGTLYNYRRFSPSDSIDWFEGFYEGTAISTTPFGGYNENIPYHQNDFGGTVGVPVVLHPTTGDVGRTFLFGSFEALRLSQPNAFSILYTPSNAVYVQAPAALRTLLGDFPLTTFYFYAQEPILLPTYDFTRAPSELSGAAIRLDHRFSAKTTAFLRYDASPSNNQSVNLSAFTQFHRSTADATFGLTTQFASGLSNEFRLGHAKSRNEQDTSLNEMGNPYPQPTDLLTDLGVPASAVPGRGQVFIHVPGIGESTIYVDQASSSLHQWNPRDIFSLQTVKHFLRFGVDYRHIVSNVNPAPLAIEADFFDADSLLNGLASDISITRAQPATPVFHEFSAFVQDQWRISKSLTLSPGLRWEVDPPPYGEHDADAYTVLGQLTNPSALQLAPRGSALWQTSWLNLAPRIGAAWSVNNRVGRETVVRAGSGIYFGTNNGPAAQAFGAIGFSVTNHLEEVPVPVTPTQLDFSTTPNASCSNALVYAFPHHFQLPYVLQWNISVDQALGTSNVANVSWVGGDGHRQLAERRIDIHTLNPQFGEVSYFPGGISSSYESLQLKFQHSIRPGVQALASYVWSHTLDYGSTAPEFPLVYGNSDLDVRHNLQAVLTWQQHPRSGSWMERYLFAGWAADGRLSTRTGFPVEVMGNLFSDPATGDRYYSGANLVAGQPLYLHGSQYPGGRKFNGGPDATGAAFVVPLDSDAGNAPRNLVRGFGDVQVNAAIAREIPLASWMNLHLRAEAFNLLNHPTLGYIDPVVSNQLFGQATLLLNQSLGSGGPLYQPGGPRSLQFSASIHF